MQPFVLYHSGSEIQVKCDEELGAVIRMCATKDEVFLVSNGKAFSGSIPKHTEGDTLHLEVMLENVVDMDIREDTFYVVDDEGFVRTKTDTGPWTEISFDPPEVGEERIKISRVKCNSLGAIFITNSRQVYVIGKCGDLFDCHTPICLRSFGGPVVDVSAGNDYFLLVTEREYSDDDGVHFGRSLFNHETSLTSRESDCLEDNILEILRLGYKLLSTEVHSFGISNNGVLGTGDHIMRPGVFSVLNLSQIGVCSVSTGIEHSIARTIDGRLFHWGRNSRQQLQNGQREYSAPHEFKFGSDSTDSSESRILEACCGDYRTIVVMLNGSYVENGCGNLSKKQLFETLVVSHEARNIPLIVTAGPFTLCNRRKLQFNYFPYLSSLQHCLHLCQRDIAKTISNRLWQKLSPPLKDIVQSYIQLVYVLVACCQSLQNFYRGDTSFDELVWFRNAKEVITVFEEYTKLYCDLRAVNFSSQVIDPTGYDQERGSRFRRPFEQISNFVTILETLSRNQTAEEPTNELNEKLLLWKQFAQQHRVALELADSTHNFWQCNERNPKLRPYKVKGRRVILAPTATPIKWYRGANNLYILFSDCLCQYGGSTLEMYPLVTIWVKKEEGFKLKITTPEKTFILDAKDADNKVLWYDQLENSIMSALGRPGGKISDVRTTAYVFSQRHPKYPKVHAYGMWRNGVMHGKCYLEYPDGRFYFGDVRNGEIEGYGKMVLPSIGMYEGNFKAGKFHGHGCFEMKDNEVYDGNFREGLCHGHGMFRSNVYTYVGEFEANAKSGYGVLDDMISGNKYMGMFTDNKRTGAGVCITMNGDYFEGIFANDELSGVGIAIFENGSYYEGHLTMDGPAGKGVYYMPDPVNDGDIFTEDSTKSLVVGNVMKGNLSGTWTDVQILLGTFSTNRSFPKFPKSIGEHVVDCSRKWRSLFSNFEEHILGVGKTPTKTAPDELWSRLAVFLNNQRNRDKLKDLEQLSSNHSYFARNISMGYSTSFDKVSLKSTSSLMVPSVKNSCSDLSDDGLPQKSRSQETLFEDWDCVYSDISSNGETSLTHSTMQAQIEYITNSSITSVSTRASIDSASTISNTISNNLDFVPNFGLHSLTNADVTAIKEYLSQAFKDPHHPFHVLNERIANCFNISYGCWKVKPIPILVKQAMKEWESVSERVYRFIRKLFPALPLDFSTPEDSKEVVSYVSLLYPILLSEGIYSTLFVLYANKFSRKDEVYRQNLLLVDKLSDKELMQRLGLDESNLSVVSNKYFQEAISTLQQVQKKYSPKAMLSVIESAVQLVTDAHKHATNENPVILAADGMMPLALFLVLRAAVPHLGAELALLDDLVGGMSFQSEMSGLAGYCYTTIKAAYEHIISNSFPKS